MNGFLACGSACALNALIYMQQRNPLSLYCAVLSGGMAVLSLFDFFV
jgi:hypothetical protein